LHYEKPQLPLANILIMRNTFLYYNSKLYSLHYSKPCWGKVRKIDE